MKFLVVILLSLSLTKTIHAQFETSKEKKLVIRCIPSIDTSSNPLLIVNKKVVPYFFLENITPNQIERVEVIKSSRSEYLDHVNSHRDVISIQLKDSTANIEDLIAFKTLVGLSAIKTCLADAIADELINAPIIINGSEFANKTVLKKIIPEQIAGITVEQKISEKKLIVKLKPGIQLML